jgi:hypothetical protein
MPNPSELIDELIASTADWRGPTFAMLRKIIHDADPEITEEVKWVRPANPMGTPVWEHNGIVCFVNILKGRVRLNLWEGASLPDPEKLFNAMLEGNKSRAIDFSEGDTLDETAIGALIKSGVARNLAKVKPVTSAKAKPAKAKPAKAKPAKARKR